MQKRRKQRSSLAGLLLMSLGLLALSVAVIHPAVSVVDAVATNVLAGAGPGELIPPTVAAESGGLLLISVAAIAIGLLVSVARLV
jgi:hypothetical protein